jgi:hypothetical protein
MSNRERRRIVLTLLHISRLRFTVTLWRTIPGPKHTKLTNQLPNIGDLGRTERLSTNKKDYHVCREYLDIFHKEEEKLTFTNRVKHGIKTPDEIPVHTRVYRNPFVYKQVGREIKEMLRRCHSTRFCLVCTIFQIKITAIRFGLRISIFLCESLTYNNVP